MWQFYEGVYHACSGCTHSLRPVCSARDSPPVWRSKPISFRIYLRARTDGRAIWTGLISNLLSDLAEDAWAVVEGEARSLVVSPDCFWQRLNQGELHSGRLSGGVGP